MKGEIHLYFVITSFVTFFSVSYFDLFAGVEDYFCTWSHPLTPARTHIHTHQDSSGRGIGPSQRPLHDNTQHSQRQASMPPAVFELAISANQWSQTHALDCAATGISQMLWLRVERQAWVLSPAVRALWWPLLYLWQPAVQSNSRHNCSKKTKYWLSVHDGGPSSIHRCRYPSWWEQFIH